MNNPEIKNEKQINTKSLALWLFTCAFAVFVMVVIGAVTRLSESGLSMVEWRPLIGALPPLGEEEWNRVFGLYQKSPEYRAKNTWMELSDFKQIFFWEWFHRFWGRMIGLIFALPLFWFWIRGQIPKDRRWKFAGLFLLGGVQGGMGWYMVKSGLVDIPAVSHYRLAAHLLLALLIFALLLWQALSCLQIRKYSHKTLFIHATCIVLILIATITWGALTAGLDAGLIYNDSFPKMGGRWIPDEIASAAVPVWQGLIGNPAGVQFVHRWLAIMTLATVISLWAHAKARRHIFPELHALGAMALLQFTLGLATLFSGVLLPVAVAHQAGAVILLGLLVICLHRLRT